MSTYDQQPPPSGPSGYPYPPQYPYPQAQQNTSNGFSIAAIVLGAIALFICKGSEIPVG